MAQGFVAVLLVCLASLPPEGCTETTALDVRSIAVDSELGCLSGWQELVAREDEAVRGDTPILLKTVCRRAAPRD